MAADLIGYSKVQRIGDAWYIYPNATFSLLPQSISWGEIVTLSYYLINIGNVASGTFSVGFYLSADSNISTSDVFLGGVNMPSISTEQPLLGSSVSFQMPPSRPAREARNYYIGMIIDVYNTVLENSEVNNSNQADGRDMVAITVLPPVATVADSIGSSSDKMMSFGAVVNDGKANASTTYSLTLTNSAAKSILKVAQNGVRLVSGANFKVKEVISNKLSQAVNTASGSSFLAANSTEIWTILLTFDPTANGNLSDTLIIETDDPVNPVINVALSGVGLGRGNLSITDSLGAANDQRLDFGDTAADGSGGQFKTATLTLVNNGSGPLTINQNSITLPTGPFTVASIVSSTQGVINLASGAKTLAAASAESWTVSIRFDPTVTGQAQQSLSIGSDDPDTPIANVTLMGSGLLPAKIAVTDTVDPQNDRLINFGAVHADGVNLQLARQSVLVSNAGQLPLIVNQNGLSLLNGSQYRIESVNSSLKGSVDLASGSATLAPSPSETWTVRVVFDPVLAGNQTDSLRISSNDLTSPLTTVSLSGTGLNQGALVVRDSDPPLDDRSQSFGAILQDGPGGRKTTRSLQLSNVGNQELLISQNGIGLQGGTHFRVASIVSSTAGAINLASGARTLLARSAETWTVAVEFDPTATGSLADALRILSNDPQQPTTTVALSGLGALPQVTALSPSRVLNASAGNVYSIDWSGQYAPGNAVYSLYYDTDRNPSSGLIQIAANLPQSISSYRWQLPTNLVGGNYTIYVAMNEAGVPGIQAGSYADGSINIDAAGTDRLLSAPVTDASTYTLTTRVNGIDVNSTQALAPGTNLLYQTTGGASREYRITRVASLVDVDHSDYDELGNVTGTTDADGRKSVYFYDQLSRLTSTKYADGESVAYTYDLAGNLLSMQDGSGWQFYSYDIRDRLTSVTYSPSNSPTDPAALRIGYEYDLSNRLTALIYPSGKRVEYGYTAAGKLNRVTEKATGQADLVTTYAYAATSGLLLKTTRSNNTETSYGYDSNGRLTDIHHRRTDTQATVLRYAYTLDASGRRTGVVVTSETGVRAEKYLYDDFNRLREVAYSDDNGTIDATDRVVRYGYDKNDRRLTQTTFANGVAAGATETLSYAYGFENRLLTVTDQNGVVQERYSYDQQGNQVQKVTPSKTSRYSYNSRNLLTAIEDGSSYLEYVYDGAGRRVAEISNGITNRLINDPSKSIFQVLEERQQNGAINADYSYGLERLSGTISGQSSRMFYLADVLGSVGALANRDGATVDSYRYDAFGGPRGGSNSTKNRYQFTGERYDDNSGLIYFRKRELNPATGSFLQKDPVLFADSPSNYVYVAANPVIYIDPAGTFIPILAEIGLVAMEAYSTGAFYESLADSIVEGQVAYRKTGSIWSGLKAGGLSLAPSVAGQMTGNLTGLAKFVDGLVKEEVTEFFIDSTSASIDAYGRLEKESADFRKAIERGDLDILKVLATPPLMPAIPSPSYNDIGNSNFSWGPALASASLKNTIEMVALPPLAGAATSSFYNAGVGRPGGVLLDKAATLIDANLDDIAGASYDPATGQIVFLGSQNPASLANVNLDLFATAIQAVFGSAVPPYVTLDPPAKLLQTRFNIGDGDGVILNGKTASIPIQYTPYTATETDDMTLSFKLNGVPQSVRLNGWVMNGQGNGRGGLYINVGGRFGQGLTLFGGLSDGKGKTITSSLVSGVTYSLPDIGEDMLRPWWRGSADIMIERDDYYNLSRNGNSGYALSLTGGFQDSIWSFSIINNSGINQTVSDLQLVSDLQHRKFGGRVDNTRLGWIIEEADRVMKALGIGKDHLTGATYNSITPGLPPGYQNLLERYRDAGVSGNFNNRFWFTPNEQTLKRFIDPATGEATVIFDRATVKLNTEALVLGQEEDIVARNWADYFTANYDAFASKTFPVYDPDDQTHTRIINVKIFDELRNAMKAVSLARFFKDNDIPLDTWWLNSYQTPVKYTPLTIPTLTNSILNGTITLTMYGGVSIKTPNAYIPDVVAKSIAEAVKSQRPAGAGDLAGQAWSVASGTSYAGMKAVATSLNDRQQDANITLGVTDLAFPSAGGRQLAFQRFYNSGYLVDDGLGCGWQLLRHDLQFQLPTYVDDAGLMRDSAGARLSVFGPDSDTRLRSGELRIFDNSTGTLLNFNSSLIGRYELDAQQNPIFLLSGLAANKVPVFTPGTYRDGSSLTQDPSTFNYTLTRADGSKLIFSADGNLLQDIDSRGYSLFYGYTNAGRPSQISDSIGQAIRITYTAAGRVDYAVAPESSGSPQRKVQFVYDSLGRLIRVDNQALQADGAYLTTRDTKYEYNSDNQLTGITGPDGVKSLTAVVDLTGRQDTSQDALGNRADFHFTADAATGSRITQVKDTGATGANNPTAHGLDAIRFFPPGSTSAQVFDTAARTTKTIDPLGNTTHFTYAGDAIAPTTITLPTSNRPSINILRNGLSLPTLIDDSANAGAKPIQITYTAANKPDMVTDGNGRITKYTYTSWQDVASVTTAFGTSHAATTTYNYYPSKLLANIIDPLGRTLQTYEYDTFGNITKLTDADGVAIMASYDSLGRLKKIFDPRFSGAVKHTEYFYNDNDQITRIVTPTGDISNAYDPVTKRLISTTNLSGNTTLYGYNTSGQLISETQVSSAGNAVTQYLYGRRGELVALTAPEGERTVFRADVLGRPVDVIEDDNVFPLASIMATKDSDINLINVQIRASEPILVASLRYWQEDHDKGSALNQERRLADQSQFSFCLTDIDPSKNYIYELTLTDRVGQSQTLPQAVIPAFDSVISLAVSPASGTSEDGATNLVYTFSRTGPISSTLIVNYSVAGTAILNSDYTGIESTAGIKMVTFAANSSTATVTVYPMADATVEPDETLSLTLAPGLGYTIGTISAVTGTILNDDSIIESAGNTSLLRRSDGFAFAQLATSTPIQLSSPWGEPVIGSITSPWQILAIETIAGVNKLLWRNNISNFLHTWILDANWNWQSSDGADAFNTHQAWSLEEQFQVDANKDGVIGIPYTTLEAQGNTKLLQRGDGRAYAEIGVGTRHEISSPWGVSIGSDSSVWQLIATESVAGVNKLLWRNNTSNFLHTWILDANWNWTSSGGADGFNTSQAWALEEQFQVDANKDGVIGIPYTTLEAQGNTKLLQRGDGRAYVEVGVGTRHEITSPWGVSIGSDSSVWQLIATESVAGVNKLLWRNNISNFLHTWTLDANWNWTSSGGADGFNTSQAWALEEQFQVDGNKDGVIGIPYTTLEAQGNTKLLQRGDGRACAEVGVGTRHEITSPWGVSIGSDSSVWQLIATESVAGVNKLLWRNNISNFLHTWTLDANWNWTSSGGADGFNTSQAWALEEQFQVDGNRDGIIGAYATIEAQGNTQLLMRADGKAFAQVGSGPRTEITSPWGVPIGSDTSAWQILAIDTIGGVNQLLWRNNTANFLHTWTLDANWNWTSSGGAFALNVNESWALESSFQVDANRDSIIGTPL